MNATRFLPFTDLRGYGTSEATGDLTAAAAATFMAVPQSVAYAVIAGLPPAMGLYAAAIPTIVGSLMRSSRHVVTGPTNAVSLLVASGVAAHMDMDPVTFGVTLAALVGVFQFLAGVLRLGALVDYISNPVVLGYITGAGLLIGVGQLPNVTGTTEVSGDVFNKITTWAQSLGNTSWLALGMALAVALLIAGFQKFKPSWPGAAIVLGIATLLSYVFDLEGHGMTTVHDLTPVPSGLPPFTIPELGYVEAILPIAIATTVLSLVESSAVARSIAADSGQRLDTSVEFAGQGLANIAAGFFGAYPTSGSLSRSALNHRSGARTRMGGVLAGVFILVVLLVLGPVVNYTPVAALAGLLLVVAIGLVSPSAIKMTMRGPWADRIAFSITLISTWIMPLDKAIYLGVGISLVLFLRKARLLHVRELAVDTNNKLVELDESAEFPHALCQHIRILHVEGHLFFGVVGELQDALDQMVLDYGARVIILRMKRTRGMDVTVGAALANVAERLSLQDRHLLLAGVRDEALEVLEETQMEDQFEEGAIFPSKARWFASMEAAVRRANELAFDEHSCEGCPIRRYLDQLDEERDEDFVRFEESDARIAVGE